VNSGTPAGGGWPVLVRKIKEFGLSSRGYSLLEVRSIKAPTLIMLGDRDGTWPEHAVEMLRLIPDAQLTIFPGADHFLLFTGADKVLGTLLPFLDHKQRLPVIVQGLLNRISMRMRIPHEWSYSYLRNPCSTSSANRVQTHCLLCH
jgi:hypothetical protein